MAQVLERKQTLLSASLQIERKRLINREKQKRFRENNLESVRDRNREWMRKKRGFVESRVPSAERPKVISIPGYGLISAEPEKEIEISLCACGKKYLTKLRCLWCT